MCPRKDQGHSPAQWGCHWSGLQKVVLACTHTHVHMYTHPHTPQAFSYWELPIKDSIKSSHFLGFPFQEILTRSPEREAGQGLLSLHEQEKPRLPWVCDHAVLRPLASTRLLHLVHSPHPGAEAVSSPVPQHQHGLKPAHSLSLGGVGASLTSKRVSAAWFTVVELFSSN